MMISLYSRLPQQSVGKVKGSFHRFVNGGVIDFVRLYDEKNKVVYEIISIER